MSFFDQFKTTIVGGTGDESNQSPRVVAPTGLPGVISIATSPSETPALDEEGPTGSAWTTFVESMEQARKRASVIFANVNPVNASDDIYRDPAPLPAVIETESGPDTAAVVGATVRSWWDEATSLMEEAKMSVEDKLAEMTGPPGISNDPLKPLRDHLILYQSALDQLKKEAYNFALSGESLGRVSSPALEYAISQAFESVRSPPLINSVTVQFEMYKQKHSQLMGPVVAEIRSGVEQVVALIGEEISHITTLNARFERRDKLHKALLDQRARVGSRRDRNNRKLTEGAPVDSKSLEELYALSRAMDAMESDFRTTSEEIVNKAQSLLENRSITFQSIFTKLVQVQNTFMYRIGSTCSVPFQEMLESLQHNKPVEDQPDDLGSHPLTWRSRQDDEPEQNQSTLGESVSRNGSLTYAAPTADSSERYAYRKSKTTQVGK